MSQIQKDHLPYLDKWGMVTTSQDGITDQNGARWTAQYVACLEKHGELDGPERKRLVKVLRTLEATEPGLLWRTPDKQGGQEGPDNTYAMFYLDSVLQTGFSKRWLKYGKEQGANHLNTDSWHEKYPKLAKTLYYTMSLGGLRDVKYVYNNEHPRAFNTSAWIGRQIAPIAVAKAVSGEWVNPFYQIAWIVGCVMSARNATSQDGKFLMWFQKEAMKGKGWFTDLAIKYWEYKFEKQWLKGLGDVLKKYWQSNGHPSIKHLMGIF